ncbi:pre-rRNA-processing protein TSR1 homolog isoform X1 [Marmota marmota marmota]|uniref:Pre-rRNA-processing protein TSR1 homolog n=1 Tax=Marmota marmota marmota TaxID=9994 RepID=A0A8C6AF35_MARMA|nr:pre-rRNA-processing protein TSR1 homolog isoform X1 [Marmota marmota marmota]XP_048648917.1 pre-rRNA-processing protein TSR1 homolog isoform X1 [Marmota marmota marmota]
MAAHRSGPLKQQNKAHKGGRHRGRGSAQRDGKGRVELKILCKKVRKELSRVDQRHRANQLRKQKKEAVLAEKRQLGSKDGPPHQVLVVALHNRISLSEAFRLLQDRDMGTVHLNEWGSTYSFILLCPRLKHRWFFTSAGPGDLHSVLDMAKVADTILFLLDPQEGWDSTGDYCLSCLFAQGLPTYTLAVQGFSGIPLKKQIDARKKLSKAVEKRFPDDRLLLLDTQQEAATLLRQLANQKRRHLAFRDRRAYLFTHAADFVPSEENKLVGTLKISGYVRGQTLNVNSLLHIVGHGDFQMKQIDAPIDPFPLNPKVIKSQKDSGMAMEVCASDVASDMEEDLKVLMKADPDRQESLQTEVIPDPMEGEQTWPTEEELSEAKDYLKEGSKVIKKVPKGTSSYQAEWILDEGGESGGERDEDDDTEQDFMEEESQDEKSEEEEEEEECETMTIGDSVRDDLYDEKMDEEAEEKMLEKYKQERMEEMFPDEMDTPRDVAAKIRFQKYRGLKSFRTSPWDPKENLPRDYARIFQFQNFTNTRKRIFKEIEEKEDEGAEVGWYVTLHVSEVPFSVVEYFRKGAPLIAFSLLPHEQKMSVLNMVVSRNPGNTEPVKAKEELIFHCGFRRFRASPLFSQHTAADKHKLQRFLTADAALVVTVYAPITFPPASVLLFKQKSNGMHSLVATGHLLSVDPDRMVIKRVVLSGHPFKIFTKMAVVRYMFFNREDVLWFKPVELRTKWGRRGHIREPLGTHGHMKCSFDGKLKSQDTVLMNLYKRVFPKWTYDPYVPEPVPWVKSEISSTVPELDME